MEEIPKTLDMVPDLKQLMGELKCKYNSYDSLQNMMLALKEIQDTVGVFVHTHKIATIEIAQFFSFLSLN